MDDAKFMESLEFALKFCKVHFPLKTKQVECIKHVINGQDTFGLLPTAFGKSMIYSLLPVVLDKYHSTSVGHHIVVLVSPLKALMEEQLIKINEMGIKAVYVGSKDISQDQIRQACAGEYSLVILSPESLFSGKWRDIMMGDIYRERVLVLAVDEAHCCIEWGKEFRRDYGRLGELRSVFHRASIIALTASAPPSMVAAIKRSLDMDIHTKMVTHTSNRANITYLAKKAPLNIEDTFHWVADLLRIKRETCPKMIIYCRSVKAIGLLFAYFNEELGDDIYIQRRNAQNRLVAMFHHATHQRIKDIVASSFPKEDSNIRLVIASQAFGLGIDCPDVHYVVHWGAARTFEGFYQESGRAGRNPSIVAYSIVYYHLCDVTKMATDDRMRDFCLGVNTTPEAYKEVTADNDSDVDLEDIYGTVHALDKTTNKEIAGPVCRRKQIIEHLSPGETCDVEPLHRCCDLCHIRCKCHNCPPLPGLDLRYVPDSELAHVRAHEPLLREVADEQRQALKEKLHDIKRASGATGLFAGDVSTGLDSKTIAQIIAEVHHIHEAADLRTLLYDDDHIQQVMAAIDEVCVD